MTGTAVIRRNAQSEEWFTDWRDDMANGVAGARRRVTGVMVVVLLLLAACGGDGPSGPPGPPPATGGFTIAVAPATSTLQAGSSVSATVTVARNGGFAGVVSLGATALPAGVTASFQPAQLSGSEQTSTLTLTAALTAAAATATVQVRGTASGVTEQAATHALTVTPAPPAGPFAMSLSVTSFLAQSPDILPVSPTLTVTRDAGFTGPVTLSVTGGPPTLIAAFTPTNLTGDTASLLIINGGASNGTYNLTIRAVAAGQGERTLTLPVTVASPSTGAVQWRVCTSAGPVWLAAIREANGQWRRIVPSRSTDNSVVFAFDVTQPTTSLAMVTPDSGGYRTTFYHYTAAQMTARAANSCALYPQVSTRAVTGTFTGVPAGSMALAGMGWWFGSASGSGTGTASQPYSLTNLPPGPLDLIAFRVTFGGSVTGAVDRGIIRRGIDLPPGSAPAPLDFTAAEAFAPTPALWTFNNTDGAQFGVTQMFTTASGSTGPLHTPASIGQTPTQRTVYSVPAAATQQGDLHQVVASIATTVIGPHTRVTRQIIAYNRVLQDRTLSFGPLLAVPTVTTAATAPLVRLRAQGTLANEYNSGVMLDVTQNATARFATVHATRGFLGGGNSYDIEMADLTGVLGWDSNFALRTGSPVVWMVSGGGPLVDAFDSRQVLLSTQRAVTGALTGILAPVDGATYLMARAVGSITP
jgi:hypothetical protein